MRDEACKTSTSAFTQQSEVCKVFSLYFWLDPKVPKSQARRKDAGNAWCLTKTGACRGFASKPAPFFHVRHRTFLSPRFSQCGRAGLWPAKKTDSDERINRNLVQTVPDSLAGRRPAYPRDVKMSDEETAAHRAPGTIVRKAESFVIVQRGARRLPDHFRLAVFFGSFFERKSKKACGSKSAEHAKFRFNCKMQASLLLPSLIRIFAR